MNGPQQQRQQQKQQQQQRFRNANAGCPFISTSTEKQVRCKPRVNPNKLFFTCLPIFQAWTFVTHEKNCFYAIAKLNALTSEKSLVGWIQVVSARTDYAWQHQSFGLADFFHLHSVKICSGMPFWKGFGLFCWRIIYLLTKAMTNGLSKNYEKQMNSRKSNSKKC